MSNFKEYLILKKLSYRTINDYMNYEKDLPENINQNSIDGFLARKKNGTPVRAFLKNYLDWLQEVVPPDQWENIKIRKIKGRTKKKETEYILIEDAYKLAEYILSKGDIKFAVIVRLLIEGGFRISELLNLKWHHIDDKALRIKIVESKTGFREVMFSARTLELLYQFMESDQYGPEQVFYFATRENNINPKQSIIIRVNQILKQYGMECLGIDLHPHMFRHGCGYYLVNVLNMPINEAAIYLGHSSVDTTMIYAHTEKNRVLKRVGESFIHKTPSSKTIDSL